MMARNGHKTGVNPKSWLYCRHDPAFEDCGGRCIWTCHFGNAVKSFRYLRDHLFLLSCSLYAVNRWIVKPRVHSAFLHNHFNDLLLIPCALPPLLWLQRQLGLRAHDRPPGAGEIALYLAVWSVLFEVIGPHLMRRATGDPYDVVAYVLGGVLAWLFWHRPRLAAAGSDA